MEHASPPLRPAETDKNAETLQVVNFFPPVCFPPVHAEKPEKPEKPRGIFFFTRKAADLALTSFKGGVGKSTLATHLAVCWREPGRGSGLVDGDEGSSSVWLQEASPEIRLFRL